MRELLERGYFRACLVAGRLLRSSTYAHVRVVHRDGELQVCKQRVSYAALLMSMGRPLMRILGTGVRVLPEREWQEQERRMYRSLYGRSIVIDVDGTLILPCLAGETLATLLEKPLPEESVRQRAIERAVVALAELHRLGFTHGDAMAENVLIDLDADVARWFDFETIHDTRRPMIWRHADDVRALLATCLIRTPHERRPEMIDHLLNVYGDEGVTRLVASSFASVWRRPLTFHLAQAPLSFESFTEIAHLLRANLAD